MTTFKEHFSEVQQYDDGYGYAINAKDIWEARDAIVDYLDYAHQTEDQLKRLKREIRENMRECWVRFQGYQNDWDGKLYNTWVITSEWKGGQPRWKIVFESNFDRHYVKYGHRFEHKADEGGHQVNYSGNSCDVCNQIDRLKQQIKDASGYGQHACYCSRSVDNGCECALKDIDE